MRLRNILVAAILLITLLGLAILSVCLVQPTAPAPASAPLHMFSSERAMQHVQQIAQAPHAMGTAEHARVREYLISEMKKLGLNPQVQEATAVNNKNENISVGYVYNLIGKLKGEGNTNQALLLVAHYDSQPNARGAGDDAAGVAAILETIRAIKQMPSPQNDLIVLLTDGEEYGLYGAKAFLKHPLAKEVAMVLNVEARGTKGPSMTFELSPENGWVAKQYIKHAPYPFVSSLAYEIYKRMPNDTDFTIFKNEGYSGLNSAFIDGFVHYHKATDSPENLDLGTLQQHGSNMLALSQHLANTSLVNTKAPDLVFFNFIDGLVVYYPQWLNVVWVILTSLLFVFTLRLGSKKGLVRLGQVLVSSVAYLIILLLILFAFVPINNLMLDMLPLTHKTNGVYSADEFFIGYMLITAGLFMLLSRLVVRFTGIYSCIIGIMTLQFMLMMLLVFTIPNAAYLLMFPLLFGLTGLLILFIKGNNKPEYQISISSMLILVLASVPAIFILTPILQIVFVAFGLQLPIGSVALLIILLGLLWPLLWFIDKNLSLRKWTVLPIILLMLGVAQLALAIENEKPSASQPLHSHVSYYLSSDTDSAYWASYYQVTDDWNQQFFNYAKTGALAEIYPHATLPYLKSEAQPLPLQAPLAEVLKDTATGDRRILKLNLSSPRRAAHLEVALQVSDPDQINHIKLAGEELSITPLDATNGHIYFTRLHGLPVSKSVELEIHTLKGAPFTLYLYDQDVGLPQSLIQMPKPPHVIAEQGGTSNLTVVRKTYRY